MIPGRAAKGNRSGGEHSGAHGADIRSKVCGAYYKVKWKFYDRQKRILPG